MIIIGKVCSFSEKILERAVASSIKSRCSICGYKVYKVVSEAKVNNIPVYNVPHNICPDCGAEYIDDEVLQALSAIIEEKGFTLDSYTVPYKYTGHYFQYADLKY